MPNNIDYELQTMMDNAKLVELAKEILRSPACESVIIEFCVRSCNTNHQGVIYETTMEFTKSKLHLDWLNEIAAKSADIGNVSKNPNNTTIDLLWMNGVITYDATCHGLLNAVFSRSAGDRALEYFNEDRQKNGLSKLDLIFVTRKITKNTVEVVVHERNPDVRPAIGGKISRTGVA